jgi:hypothetical protein
MAYINGDVEDTSDDIIDEITLYNILCRIIFTAEDEGAFAPDIIQKLIARELRECADDIISDEDKIQKALYVMVMAYRSACLKAEVEKGMAEISL